MKENVREYNTLRFFRGRKRNNAELQRLADACMDFEYRRLLIEENELDLHVCFSRKTVFNWVSWVFITLAFCCIQIQIIASGLLGVAVFSRVFAFHYKRKFQFIFSCYILALAVVDKVIQDDHGICLR